MFDKQIDDLVDNVLDQLGGQLDVAMDELTDVYWNAQWAINVLEDKKDRTDLEELSLDVLLTL